MSFRRRFDLNGRALHYTISVLPKLLGYIREHRLVQAGDRLGVAVSGGADSVALLRGFLEARKELGVVLSVVHLHHGIRGTEADADAEFVCQLARAHDVEFHRADADAPGFAAEHHLSLEAAGRRLRYRFFNELISAGKLDRVATAHNFDDQAETVLLRFLRGAWTRGLAGIYPSAHEGRIIRPLLGTPRSEILEYLRAIGQPWREDLSNANRDFLRNRVRHELLPLLEREFNPAIRDTLSSLAEIARSEDEYWTAEIGNALKTVRAAANQDSDSTEAEKPLEADALCALPRAVQRRILLAEGHARIGLTLEFEEVESILRLVTGNAPAKLQLRGAFAELIKRDGHRLLVFMPSHAPAPKSYEYKLAVPGEVCIPELRLSIRATLVDVVSESKNSGTVDSEHGGYNPATLLDPALLAKELTVRNWRPGDRFLPLRSRSEEKVKRLLQEKKVVHPEKALWPVVTSGDRIVWVRGLSVASEFAFRAKSGPAVMIELSPERGSRE